MRSPARATSALRGVLAVEDRFAPIGAAMFLLGIICGFLTAITGDFDLTQTWLLIGYALSLFILVNGVTYHWSQAEKLKAAAAASPTTSPPTSSARSPAHRVWRS